MYTFCQQKNHLEPKQLEPNNSDPHPMTRWGLCMPFFFKAPLCHLWCNRDDPLEMIRLSHQQNIKYIFSQKANIVWLEMETNYFVFPFFFLFLFCYIFFSWNKKIVTNINMHFLFFSFLRVLTFNYGFRS